jgi:predicted small secreted protein
MDGGWLRRAKMGGSKMKKTRYLIATLLIASILLAACGGVDISSDAGVDAGANAGKNAGVNAGANAGKDAGVNAGANAGKNAGVNAGVNAGKNAGKNAGVNAGVNAGKNAGVNAGVNAGANAGADAGKEYLPQTVIAAQVGCTACHSLSEGEVTVGPSLAGVGPSLAGIGTRGDAAYIRESVLEPNAVLVEGFSADVMPNVWDGGLTEAQIDQLVDYLLTQE